MKAAAVVIMMAWLCLGLAPSASGEEGAERPVLAVFQFDSKGAGISAKELTGLCDYLAARLAVDGHYRVLPRKEIRNRLLSQKRKTFKECYDVACQIELGRELAANKSLSTSVNRLADVCVVTANLYDLKRAATDTAAIVNSACNVKALMEAMDEVARQLLPKIETASASSSSSGVTFEATGKTSRILPLDYDPARFEALAFLDRAQTLARKEMPDARFLDLEAEGVAANGKANLTLHKDFRVGYRFRSPERSKRPKGLPANVDFEARCLVYVEFSSTGIEVMNVISQDNCTEPFLSRPSCPLAQVYSRARSQISAKGDLVAKLSWLVDGWFVDFGTESESVPDDCH